MLLPLPVAMRYTLPCTGSTSIPESDRSGRLGLYLCWSVVRGDDFPVGACASASRSEAEATTATATEARALDRFITEAPRSLLRLRVGVLLGGPLGAQPLDRLLVLRVGRLGAALDRFQWNVVLLRGFHVLRAKRIVRYPAHFLVAQLVHRFPGQGRTHVQIRVEHPRLAAHEGLLQ